MKVMIEPYHITIIKNKDSNVFYYHTRSSCIFVFTLLIKYEGQSKNNEPKSLLAIFVAIKSKVIHQKKAQG